MYDALTICQPSIPPRSILYQLPPIGIGTPEVESLTSYINRLAEAHCLTPATLIVEMIAPQINKGLVRKITSRGLNTLFNRSHTLNGMGEIANNFIQALEALTLRSDLQYLTLLRWNDFLSIRGFMRIYKAWCPLCYREWCISGRDTYDPLLWSIASVKICQIHQEPLQDTCPHCHKNKLPLLTWQSRGSYCSSCSALLVSDAFTPNKRVSGANSSKDDRWNLFVTNNLGELVGFVSSPVDLSKSQVYQKLSSVIDRVTEGNIAAFANLLNLPKNTVWGWCNQKSFPLIDSLLKIVDLTNLSLIDFLLNDINIVALNQIKLPGTPKKVRSKRRTPQQFNSVLVQEILSEILNEPEDLLPSIKEISIRLGCDRRLLVRHFPNLCQEIVAKRTHFKKLSHHKTIEACCNEVREVTRMVAERGEYPTEALVSRLISKPSFLRYQQVRSAFRAAQQDIASKTSFNVSK